MHIPPKIPLDKLGPIAVGLVVKGEKAKHRDYDRTVTLTKENYRPLATGEDMAHLYKRFNRRESEEDLKDVMEITQQVTPAWWNALATPARKVPGVKPVVNVMAFEGDQGEKQSKELEKGLDHFAGDRDIDHYFASKLVDEGLIDPNAFLLLNFENFDNRYTKAEVFGEVIPSWDAWNFEYRGGDLQWLLVHKSIQYVTVKGYVDPTGKQVPATTKEGQKWILYGPDEHIVFEQVRPEMVQGLNTIAQVVEKTDLAFIPLVWTSANSTGKVEYFLKIDQQTLYSVRIYAQKSLRTPAFRLGYIPDQHTGGRTMVSLLHPALPYFLKSIKAVRELDLTFAMHAFPKRIEFRPKCKAEGCTGGLLPNGDTCSAPPKGCGGSGYETIVTTADHITMPMPARLTEMVDLSKLTHYDFPPSEGLKLMMENVEVNRVGSMRAVYNSDVFIKDQIQNTLGGKVIDMQSVYDALQPLALWLAVSRSTSVYVYAAYKDLDGGGKLTVMFRYPRHFKFESAADLVTMLKAATDSGASQGILSQLNMDLADQIYVDDPRSADRAKTMARFDPFAGKTEATVLSLIAQGKTTERNEVLWTNMAYVFDQAEVESAKSQTDFYDLAMPKQRTILEKIIDALIEEMPEQEVPSFKAELGVDEQEMGKEPQQEEQQADQFIQDTALNGAQVKSLLEIIVFVQSGQLTEATARPLIKAAFPAVDDALISSMLAGIGPIKEPPPPEPSPINEARKVAGTTGKLAEAA